MSWLKTIVKKILLVSEYLGFRNSCINKVPLKRYLEYKIFRSQGEKDIYWPLHINSEVTHPRNIFVGINSNP